MKLLQFLGIVMLAGVSFMAGGSFETTVLWTHAASLGLGVLTGALLVAGLLATRPRPLQRRPRNDRPQRRLTLGHTLVGGRHPGLRPRG